MIERMYTVTEISNSYILIKGASGSIFRVYYPSKIGVRTGDKVVILFDDNDKCWLRITNAITGISASITKVEQVRSW